jgi:hypothetical protein
MRSRTLARTIAWLLRDKLATKPDFIIGGAEQPYLLRWYLIPRNRWFNIYLHRIVRSDDDRALHDHPWWSVSLCLDGFMFEALPDNHGRAVYQGDIVCRSATALHRLILLAGQPCTTLFITGPRIREWGFQCPQGWRHWKIFTGYDETGDSRKVGRGCGEL